MTQLSLFIPIEDGHYTYPWAEWQFDATWRQLCSRNHEAANYFDSVAGLWRDC